MNEHPRFSNPAESDFEPRQLPFKPTHPLLVTPLVAIVHLLLSTIGVMMATAIAWYAMHAWLQGYSYRIDLEWWVFALTGLLTILIALFTVSYQAIRAALVNPVRSLRSE